MARFGSETTTRFLEPSLRRKSGPYVCDMDARMRWLRSFPTWSQFPNIGTEKGVGGFLWFELE